MGVQTTQLHRSKYVRVFVERIILHLAVETFSAIIRYVFDDSCLGNSECEGVGGYYSNVQVQCSSFAFRSDHLVENIPTTIVN